MKKKKFLALGLVALLGATQAFTVSADEIDDVRQQKAETEAQQSALADTINDLEEQKNQITGEIDSLDGQLITTIAAINSLNEQIETTQVQLEETSANLEVAEADKETEYEAMKKRIQYLYEKGGDAGWATILLEESNIADLLNQAEYTQQMYSYDRECLESYAAIVTEVSNLQAQLAEQEQTLQSAKQGSEEEQAYLEELITEKKATCADFDLQLENANEKAILYQALIEQQNAEIQRLAEEQAAAAAAAAAAAEAEAAQQAAASESAAADTGSTSTDAGAYDDSSSYYSSYDDSASSSGSSSSGSASYSSSSSSAGQAIADYACQFIGNPYVWGGNSLTTGTDCSGFVNLVYAACGYSVSRQSSALRGDGVGVSYAEAQAGDIICYEGHVAIYLGGGQIVHASNESTGITTGSATYAPILAVRRVAG